MEEAGSMRQGGRLGRRARTLGAPLVAVALGCALALAPAPAGRGGVARACGLNSQIMVANDVLALMDPATINPSASSQPIQGEVGGIFALDYVAGKPISFTEDLSRVSGAPAPSAFSLRWSFGDQTPYAYGFTPKHTYAKPRTYYVEARIYDPTDPTNGGWAAIFDYAHIRVIASALPNPPVAHATASATVVGPETDVDFDATGSKSLDGSQLTYTWDFNDGTRQTGPHVRYRYGVLGQKTIAQLIVTDGRGAKSVDTINMRVVDDFAAAPTARLNVGAASVTSGAPVTLDAAQSQPAANRPGDRLVRYGWDFGDGTPEQATTSPSVTHTFRKAGKYDVAVVVYDQQGVASEDSLSLVVAVPPVSGPNWPLIGLILALIGFLAAVVYIAAQSQRRQNTAMRQRRMAMEFARARRVPQSAGARGGGARSRAMGQRPPHPDHPPGAGR